MKPPVVENKSQLIPGRRFHIGVAFEGTRSLNNVITTIGFDLNLLHNRNNTFGSSTFPKGKGKRSHNDKEGDNYN